MAGLGATLALAGGMLAGPAEAATTTITDVAHAASAFADSVGVNIHTSYTNTAYADGERVRQALAALGIRHVRDGLVANAPQQYATLRELAGDGIGVDLVMGDPRNRYGTLDQLLGVLGTNLAGAVESVEGPNEYDLSGDPSWVANLTSYQQQLYTDIKANPALTALPVLGPSPTIGRQTMVGDLSQWMDYGNFHYYPAGQVPLTSIDQVLGIARTMSQNKPLIATETGYENGITANQQVPTSEQAAAVYIPRLYLDYFMRGITRTYLYELVDEWNDPTNSEANYGLLRNDFTRKPAATALQNMLGLVSDTGSVATPGQLAYTLSGDTAGVRHLLLQKSDGTFVLFLWQEANVWDPQTRTDIPAGPAKSLQLSVAGPTQTLSLYRPGQSSSPSVSQSSADPLSISLGPDVTAVQIQSGGAIDSGHGTPPAVQVTPPAPQAPADTPVPEIAPPAAPTPVQIPIIPTVMVRPPPPVTHQAQGTSAPVRKPPPRRHNAVPARSQKRAISGCVARRTLSKSHFQACKPVHRARRRR